jgi:hypothetical protein
VIQTKPYVVVGKKKKNIEMVRLTNPISQPNLTNCSITNSFYLQGQPNLQRSPFQHLAMSGCQCSFRSIHFENLGRSEILAIGCAYPGVLVGFFSFLCDAWE